MNSISLVVSELVPGAAAKLVESLREHGPVEALGYAYDGLEAAQMAVRLSPDVLLAHAEMPGMNGFQACSIVSQAAPHVACALLVDEVDDAVRTAAMRAGARAVVPPAIDPAELYYLLVELSRIKQIRDTADYARATDPSQAPVTIGIMGAAGSLGTTRIAVNLGVALARSHPKEVVLFEAVPHGAHAADMLSLQPRCTLSQLAELGADAIDFDTIDTCLCTHSSTLALLPGDDVGNPRWPELLSLDVLAQLLAILRRRFRYALVMVPPMLWSGSAYLLQRCEVVLLVVSLATQLEARMAARAVKLLSEVNVPPDKVRIVASRVRRGDEVTPAEIAEWTKVGGYVALPDDPRAIEEAARRSSLVIERTPNAPISRALLSLADSLIRDLRKAA